MGSHKSDKAYDTAHRHAGGSEQGSGTKQNEANFFDVHPKMMGSHVAKADGRKVAVIEKSQGVTGK